MVPAGRWLGTPQQRSSRGWDWKRYGGSYRQQCEQSLSPRTFYLKSERCAVDVETLEDDVNAQRIICLFARLFPSA